MCGESWLAIKDSLTHHPSSQGWASMCPLYSNFLCLLQLLLVYIHVCAFVYIVCLGCLSFLPAFTLASVLYTYMSMYSLPLQCALGGA